MSLFYKSKMIPEPYRSWFEKEFGKALGSIGSKKIQSASPVAAVEDLVKEIQELDEPEEELKITKDQNNQKK